MNVEIGAEAALFPEKEYINGIAVAVFSKFSQFTQFSQTYCPRPIRILILSLISTLELFYWAVVLQKKFSSLKFSKKETNRMTYFFFLI